MDWFRKCSKFLRLVQAAEEERPTTTMEQLYQKDVKRITKGYLDLYDFNHFILTWWDKPVYNPDDAKMMVKSRVTDERLDYQLDHLIDKIKNLPDHVWKPLAETLADEYIRTAVDFDSWDYRMVESYYLQGVLSKFTLDKAMRYIILKLMDLIKRVKEKGSTEGLSSFYLVLHTSKLIPKTLLETILRRLDPHDYADLINGTYRSSISAKYLRDDEEIDKALAQRIQSIIDREKIAPHDLAELYNAANLISKNDFIKVLEKTTPEAKDFARGFVYMGKTGSEKIKFFILAEDMTPMGEDYNTIPWPDFILPRHFGSLEQSEQAIWGPILADFKLIAH